MLTVSNNFTSTCNATVRRALAKVNIIWTDNSIDSTLAYQSNDINYISFLPQVTDGNRLMPYKWAHLYDGLVCTNDGAQTNFHAVMPDTETDFHQVGWWGQSFCDGSGDFATINGQYPYLEISFASRPVFGFLISGDNQYLQFPVDFSVVIYNGNNAIYEGTFEGNSQLVFEHTLQTPIVSATRIKITINSWNVPNSVIKINEFYTSIVDTYDGDDIVYLSLLEEKEISNGSLPIGNISCNEIDISLQNVLTTKHNLSIKDPYFTANTNSIYHDLIKKNRKITVWIGMMVNNVAEYALLGTYWTGEWNTSEESSIASTTARDRMEFLRKSEFTSSIVYEDITLYDLAEIVLNDAKVNIPMYDLRWTIDSQLSNYTIPYAYFESKSYFETLRIIVEACMGQAYMDRNDVLIIEGSYQYNNSSVDLNITKNDYFYLQQPAKSENVFNRVEISTQPLSPGDPEQVFISQEIEADNNETITIDVKYTKKPVINAVASIVPINGQPTFEISDVVYYSFGAKIYVTNIGGSSGRCKIQVVGSVLIVTGSEVVTCEDVFSIAEYGLNVYKYPANHLLQSRATCVDIGNKLLTSYKIQKKDVEINWRGNPALELNDIIQAPEYQKNGLDIKGKFVVVRNKIEFSGSLKQVTNGRKVA